MVAEQFGVIDDVAANSTATSNAAFGIQRLAPPELRVISQPPGELGITHYENYVYSVNDKPSYIYHVELGIDPFYLDYLKRPVEFVYTDVTVHKGSDTRSEVPTHRPYRGHSTCTASKAAGSIYGASKSATLVIVKMADFEEDSIAEVLRIVYDHIVSNHRELKSVVSISWGSNSAAIGPLPSSWQLFYEDCRQLESISVPIFVAAGNAALDPKSRYDGSARRIIDTAPAAFFRQLSNVFPIGNCDNNGFRFGKSQEEWINSNEQIYAPGVEIACPTGTFTGTSFCKFPKLCIRICGLKITDTMSGKAAPLVAGVIADYLSGKSSGGLNVEDWMPIYRNFILHVSNWQRHNHGRRVVWNRVDVAHNPPSALSLDVGASNLTSPMVNITATS